MVKVWPEEAYRGLCIFREPNFTSDLFVSRLASGEPVEDSLFC